MIDGAIQATGQLVAEGKAHSSRTPHESPLKSIPRSQEPAPHPDGVLTLALVAKELHCSKPHVCAIIHGKLDNCTPLPVVAFGRRFLVRRATLDQWKRDNERVIIDPSRDENASERKAA